MGIGNIAERSRRWGHGNGNSGGLQTYSAASGCNNALVRGGIRREHDYFRLVEQYRDFADFARPRGRLGYGERDRSQHAAASGNDSLLEPE